MGIIWNAEVRHSKIVPNFAVAFKDRSHFVKVLWWSQAIR